MDGDSLCRSSLQWLGELWTAHVCALRRCPHPALVSLVFFRCFIFWGMSSTVANNLGMRSRWQERVGGASGYSTTCVGAQFSGNETAGQNVQSVGGGASVQTAPGKFQVGSQHDSSNPSAKTVVDVLQCARTSPLPFVLVL